MSSIQKDTAILALGKVVKVRTLYIFELFEKSHAHLIVKWTIVSILNNILDAISVIYVSVTTPKNILFFIVN